MKAKIIIDDEQNNVTEVTLNVCNYATEWETQVGQNLSGISQFYATGKLRITLDGYVEGNFIYIQKIKEKIPTEFKDPHRSISLKDF